MAGNSKQYVTFSGGGGSVSALMDEEVPQVTEGYGGFQEQPRARRRSLSLWQGTPVYKMTIPIVFDGWERDQDQSGKVAALEKMASPGSGTTPPPNVKVSGFVPHTELVWVIQNIEWGDTMRNRNGILVRQHLKVELWQVQPTDSVQSPAANARSSAQGGSGSGQSAYNRTQYGYSIDPNSVSQANTVYTAQDGETLTSIAAKMMGDYKGWKDLSVLNSIPNPNASLKGGTKLRVPTKR